MKLAGLTQRVVFDPSHGERRDCLDQRWGDFVTAWGAVPVALANLEPALAAPLLDRLELDLLVLTGGNSLAAVEPAAADAAPERDAFEAALIDAALQRNLPVLGICRGMQLLNQHFGGHLVPVAGHVACEHLVSIAEPFGVAPARRVNSYHNWGIPADGLAPALRAVATDADGQIEAVVHRGGRIAGIMWHPERMDRFDLEDFRLMERLIQ